MTDTCNLRNGDQPSNWGNLQQLGPHHISTLPRYWITRLYVALSTVMSIIVSWLEPGALTHRLIDRSGEQGWVMVGLLAVVCGFAIVDVVVNELLPEKFKLPTAKKHRHLIYMALAMGIFCMSYVFIVGEGGWFRPLVLPFWLDGFVAAAVAFLDLYQRHRAPQ
ncbi:hypothetical protein BH11PSE13_BH11PSE13_12060 [soil metagenome]